MASEFDAVSWGGSAGSATNTFSHICTGSDRALFVISYAYHGSGIGGPTSVTYNGDELDLLESQVIAGDEHATLWGMGNPASGTHDIVVTHGDKTPTEIASSSISTTGTDSDTPNGTIAKENFDGSNPNLTPDTVDGDLVISMATVYNQTLTVDGGETERLNETFIDTVTASSTEVAGGASTNMLWYVGFGSGAHFAFNVASAAGGSIVPQIMQQM